MLFVYNYFVFQAFPVQLQYNRYLSLFEEIPQMSPKTADESAAYANKLVVTDNLPKQIASQAVHNNNSSSRKPTAFQTVTSEPVTTTGTADVAALADLFRTASGGANSIDFNEIEQNKVFDWVRQERLPLFFRTDLFRDFKLCKLLTRPLVDYVFDLSSSAASSQLIGGYSRQSRKLFLVIYYNDNTN